MATDERSHVPQTGSEYEPARAREASEAFRRHVAELRAELRVAQTTEGTTKVDPAGHAR